MAMNDEETVALIAGGHTFGKAHGIADAGKYVGPEPEGAPLEDMGFGWKNSFGTGKGVDTITSGLEGAWTTDPTTWDNNYFENLFNYDWKLITGPGGANQWTPTDPKAAGTVPDAHDPTKSHAPIMFTTDLSLKMDPDYAPIAKSFFEDPDKFADAYARAWYKLLHRDMGPVSRCLGKEVPPAQIWQDPVPEATAPLITDGDAQALKKTILASGTSIGDLVSTAWAAASTYRCTDHRGGANGGRLCLAPQNGWEVNNPEGLSKTMESLTKIQSDFNGKGKKQVSMADLIVLGGCAAIEEAAKKAGHKVKVPFSPGRTDATADQTDADAFAVLEPKADGFRNHLGEGITQAAEELLVDRAHMLRLTAPEMTALVGGMRVLNANTKGSSTGVLTNQPETLTNDFFVNLLDMGTNWSPAGNNKYEGHDFATGDLKWTGSRVDLVFGSNSELRAIAEYYACDDSKETFVSDFVAAWAKVMNLDRFDVK
jgi:catalase-peroxidase